MRRASSKPVPIGAVIRASRPVMTSVIERSRSSSKSRSRVVTIPSRLPSRSTTSRLETSLRDIWSEASRMVRFGLVVWTSRTTTSSGRLTRATSAASSSIDMKRWMMPMPPSCASATARRASVTVSMLALTIGHTELEVARQPRRGVDVAPRSDGRAARDEQDVVVGECQRNLEHAEKEVYQRGAGPRGMPGIVFDPPAVTPPRNVISLTDSIATRPYAGIRKGWT